MPVVPAIPKAEAGGSFVPNQEFEASLGKRETLSWRPYNKKRRTLCSKIKNFRWQQSTKTSGPVLTIPVMHLLWPLSSLMLTQTSQQQPNMELDSSDHLRAHLEGLTGKCSYSQTLVPKAILLYGEGFPPVRLWEGHTWSAEEGDTRPSPINQPNQPWQSMGWLTSLTFL